jgi:hypothetical protein
MCREKFYIISDVANDDLQAIYYLSTKRKIDGIIIETGVPDLDVAIKNLNLFLLLYVKKCIPIYYGNTEIITKTPPIWKIDSAWALYYMEDVYYKKYGTKKEFYDCDKKYKSYKDIDFTNSTLFVPTRATTLHKILKKFKIKNFYALLGISGESEGLPLEYNAYIDTESYYKVLKDNKKTGFGNIFTIEEVTQDKIDLAKAYCDAHPFLNDIILDSSKPYWGYWDLTFAMYYF